MGGFGRIGRVASAQQRAADMRVLVALLRIYRGMQLAHEEMDLAATARPFWPWLRQHPDLLLQAVQGGPCGGGRRRRQQHQEEVAAWIAARQAAPRKPLPREVPAVALLEAIGEGMVRASGSYQPLLDAVQAQLAADTAGTRLPLDANVALLCEVLALSTTEQRLLALAAAVSVSSLGTHPFAVATGAARLVQAARHALQARDEHEVRTALRRGGRLLRSGLMDVNGLDQRNDLEDALRLSRQALLLLGARAASVEAMAKLVLRPLAAAPALLQWPHLQARTDLLETLLAQALQGRQRGVNILLHGAPGTGKTQYAAQLVRRLGACGFSVADMDPDGDPASRAERLGSLLLTQIFAPAGRSIVVLDEAEDIFQGEYNNPMGRVLGKREDSKSWTNHLLEHNAHPVVWISNRIDHLDPAYVRRFTYCLEFPTTPRRVRRAIAEAQLAPLGCSPQLVDAVAADPNVSPALLTSAARFTTLAQLSGRRADEGVQLMLADMLKALGHKMRAQVPERSTRFDLRYLHVRGAVTAPAVLAGLERVGRGRLLLGGPPGTGKTQLAAEIAQRLGRELVYRTASDINSMWFGESERQVARMFEECDAQGEVLFLDEADTLLGARDARAHRAETAVTAEFLRQVEAFTGVFVCATNFASQIDPALLRRFEYRLAFLPLRPDQRRDLFCEAALGWNGDAGARPDLAPQVLAELDRLDQLTPGDFANVVRRLRALQLAPDALGWVAELRSEHDAKPGAGRGTIGFT